MTMPPNAPPVLGPGTDTNPRPRVDPPGTCHLVGCPDKGRHAPHLIGVPDSFAPYEQPSTPAKVLLELADVEVLVSLISEDGGIGGIFLDVRNRVLRALAQARNS